MSVHTVSVPFVFLMYMIFMILKSFYSLDGLGILNSPYYLLRHDRSILLSLIRAHGNHFMRTSYLDFLFRELINISSCKLN